MLAIVVIASMFLAQSPPATPVPSAPKQEAQRQDAPKQESAKPAAPPPEPAKPAPKPAPKPPTVVTANDVLHVAPQTGLPREKFTFFGEEFDCELCLTPASRNAGMGARTEFPEGTAMIFVHPTPMLLNYWMKDCLIDMDMVMVDDKGVICALHEAVRERLRTKGESLQDYEDRLRRYLSNRRAKFVLEFPSGTIARLQPKLGQRIAIDWKSLDARAE
jgi:uncharacterized membrane protein (UPF0127 family)